jgi:alkylation response protein AidB-like acyl-CoA dehydrogenase
MLVDTVASFAKKESPVSRFRKLREHEVGWEKATWKQMGELGWLALPFPESVGGLGGSFVDVALVLEQLGTTLVPEPYVPSVVLAGQAIARAGDEAAQQRWLPSMIAGDTSLALAYAERDGRFFPTHVKTRAEKADGGWALSGEKIFVQNGHAADAFVVSARTSGNDRDAAGVSLFALEAKTPGVTVRRIAQLDGRKAAIVTFENARIGADALLGEEGKSGELLEDVLDQGAVAACAESVGLMRTVLDMTTDYLRTRKQFGVQIGTFQALQHRAVDMFIETELARSMSMLASLRVASTDAVERRSAISAAKAHIAWSGRYVTQQSIQLHGGIGVTDEHDVGLYFKRMHVLGALFGDEEHHVERFARLTQSLHLPEPEPEPEPEHEHEHEHGGKTITPGRSRPLPRTSTCGGARGGRACSDGCSR